MIKTTNLNKHYNNADINVINNTSLELPESGLISFIGKSGSGKTTLLNVIGGLDKADSGSISYDDISFKKYNMKQIDKYRQKHIGYVFQNYLLIENITVHNNLKIALELIGITNHEEQEKRIKYVLEAVGMYKYRKKQANKLSGGQMQRVSIARALLKESKLIIADEPTGNLDSENSIEVMNILKKISKKTLVLLVTHNKELADFYSDRIIEIADGTIINDEQINTSNQTLNITRDNQIHLLDLNKEDIEKENTKITLYKDNDEEINIRIILKNNTLYIDSNKNIQLSNQTSMKIINDHYKPQQQKEINNYNFDISWYNNNLKTNKFISILKNLKNSFFNFFHSRKKTKAFHIIFFFIGIVIAFSTIEASKYKNIDTTGYSTENAYYLIENDNDYDYYTPYLNTSTILDAINNDVIEDIYKFNNYMQMDVSYPYNSIRNCEVNVSSYNYPFAIVKDEKMLCGSAPLYNQVVIGKELADYILKHMQSIDSYQQIVNLKLGLFTISGISSVNTNSLYYNSFYYYTENFGIAGNYSNHTIRNINKLDFNYKLISGNIPTNSNEIMINSHRNNVLEVGSTIIDSDQNKSYTVVGLFDTTGSNIDAISYDDSLSDYILKDNELIKIYNLTKSIPAAKVEYKLTAGRSIKNDDEVLIPNGTNIPLNTKICLADKIYKAVGTYEVNEESSDYYLTSDKEWNTNYISNSFDSNYYSYSLKNPNNLSKLNLKASKVFDYQYNYNITNTRETRNTNLVVIIIFLVISIIYVYFSTRSKLISEIKEIGVYRSIGATKWQIYSKYLADIFINSTFTSIIGYIIIVIGYTFINTKLATLTGDVANINVGIYILGALVLYLINFIFGLLPVFTLMRKTPAEINSKYDI